MSQRSRSRSPTRRRPTRRGSRSPTPQAPPLLGALETAFEAACDDFMAPDKSRRARQRARSPRNSSSRSRSRGRERPRSPRSSDSSPRAGAQPAGAEQQPPRRRPSAAGRPRSRSPRIERPAVPPLVPPCRRRSVNNSKTKNENSATAGGQSRRALPRLAVQDCGTGTTTAGEDSAAAATTTTAGLSTQQQPSLSRGRHNAPWKGRGAFEVGPRPPMCEADLETALLGLAVRSAASPEARRPSPERAAESPTKKQRRAKLRLDPITPSPTMVRVVALPSPSDAQFQRDFVMPDQLWPAV